MTQILDPAPGQDDVGRRFLDAHRATTASTLRLFDLIRELEDSQAHLPLYADAVSWLRWHLGLTSRTARRYVRIARSFSEFPLLRDAFGQTVISLDQLELLLRVATDDNQESLLELARECPDVDDLRSEIADREQRGEEQASEPAKEPRVLTSWRGDALHLRGTVPGVDGVMVEKALLRLAEKTPKDENTGLYRLHDLRMGEALIQMASESLGADGNHDRATMVVHIPAVDLVRGEGEGWDAASRIFSAAELQRLACDACFQPALHDKDGVTVGVGRTTRNVEAWLRRLVEGRDQGCRFPGCGKTRWLQCHHIIPWSQLGPTNLDNLVALCGFHHRMIHNGDWTITGDPNGEREFFDKWGFIHAPPSDRFPANWDTTTERCLENHVGRLLERLAVATPP